MTFLLLCIFIRRFFINNARKRKKERKKRKRFVFYFHWFQIDVYLSESAKFQMPLSAVASRCVSSIEQCTDETLLRLAGVFGIHPSHQIPNTPCDRSLNDVFLNQHLQWYHNFDSVAARKLVRAIGNHTNPNELLFSIHEVIVKKNISVESYKCTYMEDAETNE